MFNSSEQNSSSTSTFSDIMIWTCFHQGPVGVVLKLITALIFFVGTPIHCWSLWVFFHKNNKPNLVFPLNITVLELIYCLLCFINVIITSSFSVIGYKLVSFVIGISWTVRPLLQICMCVEHYLAVIHPVMFLRYKGIQYRIVFSALAWLIGMGNSLRLILTEIYSFPDHVFFLFFCIAVILTSFCCASVLHALKRPGPGDRNNVEMTEKDRHNKTDREKQQKRKAFRIISHILLSILICYLPLVIANFMRIALIDEQLYLCKVFPLVLFITLFTLFLSPLIRFYSDGHLKHSMCCSKIREVIKGK